MAILLGESFDCRLAVDHCSDDLALFARFLGADNDVIAIADCKINHGVADDLEKEELTLSDKGLGEWEDLFNVLLGKDWSTSGDATD